MHLFTGHRPNTKRRFAYFDLPDNPICWLFGHRARVEVIESRFASIDAWVLIECRICGRRYNGDPSLLSSVTEGLTGRARTARLKEIAASRVEVARRDPQMVARSATGRDGYSRGQAQFSYEHGTGQKWRWFSAGIHVGTRHSESPWHAHLYVPNHSFHLSAGGVGQRFAHWLGRGHKRDLEVSVSRGKYDVELAWKGWYDDQGGNDRYHDCDGWRPMPWERARRRAKAAAGDDWARHPESRGAHHRSWACLRQGSIALNPATVLWGRPLFHREKFGDPREAMVNVGEFPGDHYLVTFTLERTELRRDRGPAWARRLMSEHWSADWRAPGEGIPVRNHDWKGDGIIGSAERVSVESVEDDTWLLEAVRSLVDRTKKDRVHHRYRPPADRKAL